MRPGRVRRALVGLAKRANYHTRLYRLALWLRDRLGRPAVRIFYHHRLLTPQFLAAHAVHGLIGLGAIGDFERNVRLLKGCAEVVDLRTAIARLEGGGRLRRSCCAVVFDDGFADNYTELFPIMRRHGVPFTVAVVSGYIGTAEVPWFQRVINILEATDRGLIELRGTAYETGGPEGRAAAVLGVFRALRRSPLHEIEAMLADLARAAGADGGADDQTRMLTWDELREMAASGLVGVANHTAHHPYLSRESVEVIEREIAACDAAIRGALGAAPAVLAYPAGRPDLDYDQRAVDAARRIGYRAALSTEAGRNYPGDDPYRLKRDASIRRDFYSFAWDLAYK